MPKPWELSVAATAPQPTESGLGGVRPSLLSAATPTAEKFCVSPCTPASRKPLPKTP